MSPPLMVTEDTPPDMLAGAMDLLAVLPNGHNIKMSVERSTPMMDLLIQITTANKISPGGHAIRAYGDRGILPYQPSTPIGALDAWSIHIVPKKSSASTNAKKQPPFQSVYQNTPFEQTFRLQVNLPRNQLYVSRVSYNMRLEQIFRQVCDEKNLDPSKYCLVRPDNLDEELNLNSTLLECKLQKVTLVPRSNRPQVGLSSVDIMALKRLDNANQRCGNKYYASHSYDGSVSSGSLEGRSLSPVRSDESSTSPTTSQTNVTSNKPCRKRRPAPKPPTVQNGRDSNGGCESLTVLHSRNSSDSSGYHESSVLSESPESNSNCLAESLPRRSKLPDNIDSNNVCRRLSSNAKCSPKIGNNLSRSLSNLATNVDDHRKCPKNFPSTGMKPKQYSASSTSLSTIPGKRKKAPAPPPPLSSTKSLLSLEEEETPGICSGETSSMGRENAKNDAAPSSSAKYVIDSPIARNAPPPPPQTCSSPSSINSRRCSESHILNVDVTASQSLCTDHLPGNTISGYASGSIKCNSFDHLTEQNSAGDCTLRRRKKIRSASTIPWSAFLPPIQPLTARPPPVPLPKSTVLSNGSGRKVGGSDLRDRLISEISNFRFKSKPCGPIDQEGWRMSAITVPGSEMSYVQRRKSEIEARLSGADVTVDHRKYSEGSLTFSKIPCNFFFDNNKRHVVFDSKNSPIDKRHSLGDVTRWRAINGTHYGASGESVSSTKQAFTSDGECINNKGSTVSTLDHTEPVVLPSTPSSAETNVIEIVCENASHVQSDQSGLESSLDSSMNGCSQNDLGNSDDRLNSSDSDNGSATSASTLDVDECHSMLNSSVGAKDKELIMDDDEIDRIFRDATKGYESAPSSTISSPPESVENNVDTRKDEICDEDLESWQYTLPSPPKGFRDATDSPQVTEFDDVTLTNAGVTSREEPRLKQEFISPILPQPKESKHLADDQEQTPIVSVPVTSNKWETKYSSSTHDSGLGSDDSIPSVHETKTSNAFKEVKPMTIQRRASTLQNFTISTYQNSKPTEIFRDESVKTWRTTELAKNNRPFVSQDASLEKLSPANNLGRHCSFNAIDRTPNSQIKRSKSHISLLSGNFAKFNQFGKLDVKLEDVDDESDTLTKVDLWKQNKLRSQSLPSTNSSMIRMSDDYSETVTRVIDKDENEIIEPSSRIRFLCQQEEKSNICHDESGSQLQSLQIMKNILPQIDKNKHGSRQGALSLESCENVYGTKGHNSVESKIKSYNGQTPSVNLQSWNERPRRQVSIKTDHDYVFGGSGQSCVSTSKVNDQSRVPVVTAVEFKKPFTPPRVTVNENDHPKRKSSTIVMVSEQKLSPVFSNKQSSASLSASKLWSSDNNGATTGENAISGRISNFTFKEYKNKLASKEKCSQKKEYSGSSYACPATKGVSVNCSTYDYDDDIKINSSDKTSICSNGDAQKIDSFAKRQRNSENSFAPILPVPPNFLKPALKPVNRNLNSKRSCSTTNLDPRDLLLSSIKNFDRDRLRKLRVK